VFGLRIAAAHATTADSKFDAARDEARSITVEEMVTWAREDEISEAACHTDIPAQRRASGSRVRLASPGRAPLVSVAAPYDDSRTPQVISHHGASIAGRSIEQPVTPAKAGAAGVVLSALNPKNLLLIVAGMAAIAQTRISTGEQAVAVIVFMLIASIGVAVPVVIDFALGDRSAQLLDRLKTWMTQNNAVIMAVLLLIIGVKLVGDAISGLS
jgi:hypothetical protein